MGNYPILPFQHPHYYIQFRMVRSSNVYFIICIYKTHIEILSGMNFINLILDWKEWECWAPTDISFQKNAYDCGAYCSHFSEVLIRKSTEVLKFHNQDLIAEYRKHIKAKIIRYMKKNLRLTPQKFKVPDVLPETSVL